MSLVLNTNIDSLIAQNSLTTSGNSLTTALQQLSSGLQINTAADNAAGYAISQGMTSQINGLNQAAQNANDGVSLTQTAQGALTEITNDLQTMRDLAVQSLNGTNSAQDRADLNQQFNQLSQDINQVASTASFNGVMLLDGSFQGQTFQIGANAGQTITVSSVASVATSNLGQLYTAGATDPAAYTSDGTTAGTAVASGDSGSITLTVGGKTYTTSSVSLTGTQSTDLATLAAAITQATGNAGVVATVDSTGKGIDLSSTTQQTVAATYTAGTGSETLATFGLSASSSLTPSTSYSASGTGGASTMTSTDAGTFSINVGGTTYTTASIAAGSFNGTASHDLGALATALNSVAAFSTAGYTASAASGQLVISGGSSAFTAKSAAWTPSAGTGTITTGFEGATGIAAAGTATGATTSTLATASVKTLDASNKVLIQIDAALQQLATTGAQLGAYQNRFQAAITGLQTDATNMSSAKSQIVDTNYAQATTDLSKAQILQQASTSMVAQANTIPQQILSLLQKLP